MSCSIWRLSLISLSSLSSISLQHPGASRLIILLQSQTRHFPSSRDRVLSFSFSSSLFSGISLLPSPIFHLAVWDFFFPSCAWQSGISLLHTSPQTPTLTHPLSTSSLFGSDLFFFSQFPLLSSSLALFIPPYLNHINRASRGDHNGLLPLTLLQTHYWPHAQWSVICQYSVFVFFFSLSSLLGPKQHEMRHERASSLLALGFSFNENCHHAKHLNTMKPQAMNFVWCFSLSYPLRSEFLITVLSGL